MPRPSRTAARGGRGREDRDEGVEIDRLGEVVIEPGFPRELAVALLSIAGNGDHRGLGEAGRAEPASEAVSVETGQTDIEEQKIGLEVARQVQCGEAVVGGAD